MGGMVLIGIFVYLGFLGMLGFMFLVLVFFVFVLWCSIVFILDLFLGINCILIVELRGLFLIVWIGVSCLLLLICR